MRNRNLIIVCSVFFLFLGFTIVSGQISSTQPVSTTGDDCLSAHSSNYVTISGSLIIASNFSINASIPLSISFKPAISGIYFSVKTSLGSLPLGIKLLSGAIQQNKATRNANTFTANWEVTASQSGHYQIPITVELTVNYQKKHPQNVATYTYVFNADFSVSPFNFITNSGTNSTTTSIDTLTSINNNTPSDSLTVSQINRIIGQVLGFFSLFILYISIQFGMPQRKLWIGKKFNITGNRLKQLHCNIGYLTVASIFLHLLFLSQTLIWSHYFAWYEFYPTFRSIVGFETMLTGLNLAALGFCVFLLTMLAGVWFKRIAQKWGYKFAIFTQQISYLGLIFSVIHGLVNGSWTQSYPILAFFEIICVSEIILSRSYILFKQKSNKRKQAEGK
jgi:hypothetical protein